MGLEGIVVHDPEAIEPSDWVVEEGKGLHPLEWHIDVGERGAGYYLIEPNIHLNQRAKPSRWRRWWTRELLGWEWKDGY